MDNIEKEQRLAKTAKSKRYSKPDTSLAVDQKNNFEEIQEVSRGLRRAFKRFGEQLPITSKEQMDLAWEIRDRMLDLWTALDLYNETHEA